MPTPEDGKRWRMNMKRTEKKSVNESNRAATNEANFVLKVEKN